jgi:hypothetical protein
LALASVLKIKKPLAKLRGHFNPHWSIHSLAGNAEAPVDRVDAQVRSLGWVREDRGDKQGSRHDPDRPISPGLGSREIPFNLAYELQIGALVNLVEDQNAVLPLLLQEIEEALEQEDLIFPQVL